MNNSFNVAVSNIEQLKVALKYNINKLYIPFDLFYCGKLNAEHITRIHENTSIKVYLALPEILRKKDDIYLEKLKEYLLSGKADGVLIKNVDELGFILSLKEDLEKQYISLNGTNDDYTPLYIDSDSSLYTWNINALNFIKQYFKSTTAPLELSVHELVELKDRSVIISIYGHAPLMKSANCIRKTSGNCGKDTINHEYSLIDRKNINTPVFCNCIHCFNICYNSFPTSLHKQFNDLCAKGFYEFRLDFTLEDASLVTSILDYYINRQNNDFPLDKYTCGHIQKGAI